MEVIYILDITDKIKEWDKLLESQLMADYTNDIAFVDKESEEE